jgi:DNA-binding MarR family transcriptional regulator
MLTPSDRLVAVLEEFRKHDPTLPLQTCLTFVLVAIATESTGKGILMKELEKRLGLPVSSTVRNVQALSFRTDERKEGGLDLVAKIPDPEDPRARYVRLTPKGRRVWVSILQNMEK